MQGKGMQAIITHWFERTYGFLEHGFAEKKGPPEIKGPGMSAARRDQQTNLSSS